MASLGALVNDDLKLMSWLKNFDPSVVQPRKQDKPEANAKQEKKAS